jgi:phosphoserine aminotransferase
MPESVLEQLREELIDFRGTGIGLLEHSHRGASYDQMLAEAVAAVRGCSGLGEGWDVLFLPGGSMQHFPLIAMNFVPKDGWVAFADTGLWANKGEKETACVRRTQKAFDGAPCRFDHVPGDAEIADCTGASYFCYCSNNTVEGTQFARPPKVAAPLVCDATSDIFSRPFDLAAHQLVFASGQKNLGASGICMVLARRAWLERADPSLPPMLSYAHFSRTESRPNTPPTFGASATPTSAIAIRQLSYDSRSIAGMPVAPSAVASSPIVRASSPDSLSNCEPSSPLPWPHICSRYFCAGALCTPHFTKSTRVAGSPVFFSPNERSKVEAIDVVLASALSTDRP